MHLYNCREICKDSKQRTEKYIEPLAKAYLHICDAKKPDERDLTEFFGLRDFYRYYCCQICQLFIIVVIVFPQIYINDEFIA